MMLKKTKNHPKKRLMAIASGKLEPVHAMVSALIVLIIVLGFFRLHVGFYTSFGFNSAYNSPGKGIFNKPFA